MTGSAGCVSPARAARAPISRSCHQTRAHCVRICSVLLLPESCVLMFANVMRSLSLLASCVSSCCLCMCLCFPCFSCHFPITINRHTHTFTLARHDMRQATPPPRMHQHIRRPFNAVRLPTHSASRDLRCRPFMKVQTGRPASVHKHSAMRRIDETHELDGEPISECVTIRRCNQVAITGAGRVM